MVVDVADWVRGSHPTMTASAPIAVGDASGQSALLRTPSLTYSAFDSPRSSVFTSLTTPPASPFECPSELAEASDAEKVEVVAAEGRSPDADDDEDFFAEWERDVKRYTAKRGRRAGVKNRANLARKDAARRAMSIHGGFDAVRLVSIPALADFAARATEIRPPQGQVFAARAAR